VGDADHGALADLVGHLAVGDRVDVDEVGAGAVELLAAGADERAAALAEGLLRAGEHDPDVEVLRRLRGEVLGRGEDSRDARGVVVGAGDDLREGDVDEQEGRDDQDDRRDCLDRVEPGGVKAGHAGAEDREEGCEADPEEEPEGAEAEASPLWEPADPL
jgi:hypothetical protein